ncbi:MAG: ABC transporter permease [Lachnospiraceae bacterium]|jgi:ABC-type uncharacterized transport system permease subunit|nr:ABC transporter permease [Lachnospiraceae bacterium]
MNSIIIDGMSFTLPLFIMAIGGIYSERSGITNLALEGLQGMGAFIGALAAYIAVNCFGMPQGSAYYLAFLFAIIGGAVYAMLHALLCIRFKANQVISGVVINLLATSLTVFLTKSINKAAFGAASNKIDLGVSARYTVPGISNIPVLGAFFTDVYPFELIIVAAAFLAWFVMYRTPYGLHLRACGDNPHAADAAGLDVARIRFTAVMVSGALSGIAGMSFAYSIFAKFSGDLYVGYGFLSIAALIFGSWTILPTLGACMIFGFARSAGYQLVQMAGLPSAYSDLIMILPYVLTLILLMFFSKNNQSPRALGEVYDKARR